MASQINLICLTMTMTMTTRMTTTMMMMTLTTGDSSLPGQCSLMTGLEMATHVQIAPATLLQIAHYCHTIAGCTNHTIAVGGQLLHLLHYAVSFYTIAPTPKHTHTHTHTCYCTPWPYTLLLHHLHLHCTAFALPPSSIYANNTKCIECTWKGNMWINSVQTGEMQGGRGAIEGLGCNAVESQ